MRIDHLSYSSLNSWESNPFQWFLERILNVRSTTTPQQQVGTDFHEHVQHRLDEHRPPNDSDDARHIYHSIYAVPFELLKKGGRCEVEIKTQIEGVPFHGYVDYLVDDFVLDWKVNGYMREATTSPKPGYEIIYPKKFAHKRWQEFTHLEESNYDWGTQLGLYQVALGIGDSVAGVDQIVGPKTRLRVAQYRKPISRYHKQGAVERLKRCWDYLSRGHYFCDLTERQSADRAESLKAGYANPEWSDLLA